MVDITISVSQALANKFVLALEHYNEKNETEFTPMEMVKRLARQFVIDTVRELRVSEGAEIGEVEVEGL